MNNMEVRVHEEISEYKEKFYGLTLRRWISVIITVIVDVPLYIFLNSYIPDDILQIMVIIISGPVLLIGFVPFQQLPMEKFLKYFFRNYFNLYKPLEYKTDLEVKREKEYYESLTFFQKRKYRKNKNKIENIKKVTEKDKTSKIDINENRELTKAERKTLKKQAKLEKKESARAQKIEKKRQKQEVKRQKIINKMRAKENKRNRKLNKNINESEIISKKENIMTNDVVSEIEHIETNLDKKDFVDKHTTNKIEGNHTESDDLFSRQTDEKIHTVANEHHVDDVLFDSNSEVKQDIKDESMTKKTDVSLSNALENNIKNDNEGVSESDDIESDIRNKNEGETLENEYTKTEDKSSKQSDIDFDSLSKEEVIALMRAIVNKEGD